MFVLLLASAGAVVISAGGGHGWGYEPHNGPEEWGGSCQSGFRQSPIDIRATNVDYTLFHRLHFSHYDHAGEAEAVNNGHTISVSGFEKWGRKQPTVHGGGLRHKYKLAQFHLHWAQHDHHGSEHKIGGLHYPAELHFVHVREDLTLAEALTKGDGLAVVGVFLSVDEDHGPMRALSGVLPQLVGAGNSSSIEHIRPRSMLPPVTEAFYRYDGSLTTPGCNEAVVWTVLAEPISITKMQLRELRAIQSTTGSAHGHNYRPVQPMNGRRVLYRPSQFDRSILCKSSSATTLAAVFSVLAAYLF